MWKTESIEAMKCHTIHGKGWLIGRRYWEHNGIQEGREFFIIKLKLDGRIVYVDKRPIEYKPAFSWMSWDDSADGV